MKKLIAQALVAGVINVALADPVTPLDHAERDYRSIGGGFYMWRDDQTTTNDSGNTTVDIFSRGGISVGQRYSLGYEDESVSELRLDAGTLGILRENKVILDCANHTYQVLDIRYAVPREVWLVASTLPALAPIFRYVCKLTQKAASAPIESTHSMDTNATEATPVVTFPRTDAALNDIARLDPSAARKIMSFCKQASGQDANGSQENQCRANEIMAWNRLSASGGLDAGIASGCPSPPFPIDFVGEETCLKYKNSRQ